jgi:UPF0716 protein FxsA
MWLFLFLVAIPVIEIGLFIQVGGWLGLWPTLAIVVLTAFIGSNLLRQQGLATLKNLQGSVSKGENPMDPIAHAAMILVSGVLLLTPGFFTDGIGFALLLPPVRNAVIKWGAARILQSNTVVFSNMSQTRAQSAPNRDTLEGEYEILDDEPDKPGTSGWTKPDV